ncbi:MFS transporter, PAT family, beta-lactamase induction signal transducer AmpG [Flagellimonas taeanensis]|uniref:MFS transporter, PAT family, beta-lactamase induction signal transducer AmpG n=1 Tax=Flagellimonas taeanensis TaxID=1005926 RepID=A0A1M6S977_9FLAO|nr:MFS transporter [Allomuricauda taeanensis]SFB79300.1 MFS transporter, PAT family, beta-lactamase induction signal transducer AmpG [Allomuricauda taeanensis]SHK41334.1 MFS transporter, PAT family, beta-lactamase induction signal transducer AmpG [Allomuricauda taeanensis]
MNVAPKDKNAWLWIPFLYFTQGIPYILVVTVSVIMYKRLGIGNAEIGLYTSWLYLPWVIKPLWSPIVDLNGTKRKWFLGMQLVIALAFLGIGLFLPSNSFFTITLAFFWMAAFASATNDIASDGYYMIGLTQKKQSFFIGLRSTFYRLAMVTGQGLLVIFAGFLENRYGDNTKAWSVTMISAAVLMIALTISNFFATPKFEETAPGSKEKPVGFFEVFASFFKKKQIGWALLFILTYRLGESQLVKMASPFLLDKLEVGGLAYSTEAVGTIYGTVGIIMLSLGGILGGILISRDGLKKWMLPMLLALNLPNALYALLAITQSTSMFAVVGTVVIEQFGYGFGFAAFMMYLIYVAEGASKTSHYAIATGFMALGMMLPGMLSGYIQEWLGYGGFFTWVVIAALPAFVILRFLKYPTDYGKKTVETND